MPIKIGICDDQIEDAQALSAALYDYDPTFQIVTYANGESLLMDCCEDESQLDLLFLDIYMPGLNGLELAGRLRAHTRQTKLVIYSSSDEHYREAYDLFAFNYLLKPFNREKLNDVLDQVLFQIAKEHEQQISFSYKGTTYRLYCREILYVESSDKLVLFHMVDKAVLQCYAKIDVMLRHLPERLFIRCHQSYAINALHVVEMTENHFRIGQSAISISRRYAKAAKEKYYAYLFTHMNEVR